jgi:hypothetical protein
MAPTVQKRDIGITAVVGLGIAGVLAWALIWGYFEVVESRRTETWWWTERHWRIWTTTAIGLFAPAALAAAARATAARAVPFALIALVPATVIAIYTGNHYADPLRYDNPPSLVYAVFANTALSMAGLGIILPVATQWRRLFTPDGAAPRPGR